MSGRVKSRPRHLSTCRRMCVSSAAKPKRNQAGEGSDIDDLPRKWISIVSRPSVDKCKRRSTSGATLCEAGVHRTTIPGRPVLRACSADHRFSFDCLLVEEGLICVTRDGSTPACVRVGAYSVWGAPIMRIGRFSWVRRAIAGRSNDISPQPVVSVMISVIAPTGQPRHGRKASSTAKFVAMPGPAVSSAPNATPAEAPRCTWLRSKLSLSMSCW